MSSPGKSPTARPGAPWLWLALVVIWACLATGMATHAIFAATNALGLPDPPKLFWQIIFWFGALLAACSLMFLVYDYRHIFRPRRPAALVGMIVCGIGFAFFAGMYIGEIIGNCSAPTASDTNLIVGMLGGKTSPHYVAGETAA